MERRDRLQTAWEGFVAAHVVADERGTTPVDWMMLAALAFSAVILVTTLGGTWFGGVA
jgi:hypothetical protein